MAHTTRDNFARPDKDLVTRPVDIAQFYYPNTKNIDPSLILGRVFMSKDGTEVLYRVTGVLHDVDKGSMYEVQPENCTYTERMTVSEFLEFLEDHFEAQVKS
jgi:hypothetical protein